MRVRRWRTWVAVVLFGFGAPGSGRASEDSTSVHLPFRLGEKLTYAIKWGPLRAGTAVMWVRGVVDVESRPCFHIVSEAQSNAFFSLVYPVTDRVETWVDIERLVPLRHEKHLREGTYRQDEVMEFDHAAQKARYSDGEWIEFEPGVQDILSALYYVRTLKIPQEGSIFVENQTNKKNYTLEVVIRRRERIQTPAGAFLCSVIEPFLKATGLFKQEGRLWIWLTEDDRRLPVVMKSKIRVGSITAELEDISFETIAVGATAGLEGGRGEHEGHEPPE